MGDFGYVPDEKEVLKKQLEWYNKRYGPYIEKRGFHNWKNLFRKPTLQELTVLFIVIMALVLAFTYQGEIKTCQETLVNLESICISYCSQHRIISDNIDYSELNITWGEYG